MLIEKTNEEGEEYLECDDCEAWILGYDYEYFQHKEDCPDKNDN